MASKSLCLVLCLALFTMEAHGSKKFVAFRRTVDFFTAVQLCRQMGARLAPVETEAENTAVNQAIKNLMGTPSGIWWIGGMDFGNEGTFIWYTLNKKITFNKYSPGDIGNGNCLVYDIAKGNKWDDTHCDSATEGFICAFPHF